MSLSQRKPLAAKRKKKCRNPECSEWFRPPNSLAFACSPKCALDIGRVEAKKEQRQKDKETRKALKTRSEVQRETQTAFNAWVRERDADRPCISCGTTNPMTSRGGSWDCGHYRSTGANPELRFEPLNAAKQCKRCNSYLSGNVVNFRIGLRARIGDAALAWVEGAHDAKHYGKQDLIELRDYYRREARRLKKENRSSLSP